MKLLILILPFIIYQLTTTQEVGGFTEMDLSEAKQDPTVIKNLRFGVNQIIDQEVAAGRLPDCHYTVDNIYSVYTQVVSGINYRFDVSIKNRRGWEIRATFVVYSQEWTDTTELTSYTYDVTTCPRRDAHDALFDLEANGECPRGYERIDESELDEDPELRAAFDAGLEAAIAEAIRIHRLPDADYEVSEIHSIYSRESGSGKNYHRILQEDEITYRFDVSITNCAGLTARLVFIVNVDGNDFDTTLVAIRITTIPDEGLVGDEVCGAGEEGEIPGEQGDLPNEEV